MRDPKRIKPILKLLKKYWKKNPDLRLGQILYNLSYTENIWNIEDSELMDVLSDLLAIDGD